jgi:hypothetical protein
VIVDGFPHKSRDELHAFWDTQFVDALARSPVVLANQLIEQITPTLKTSWEQGSVDDWAMEAFELSKLDAYTDPPLSKDTVQHLDADYAAQAEEDVGLQLSRAGVRLAAVLNKALGPKNSSNGAQNDR